MLISFSKFIWLDSKPMQVEPGPSLPDSNYLTHKLYFLPLISQEKEKRRERWDNKASTGERLRVLHKRAWPCGWDCHTSLPAAPQMADSELVGWGGCLQAWAGLLLLCVEWDGAAGGVGRRGNKNYSILKNWPKSAPKATRASSLCLLDSCLSPPFLKHKIISC